MQNIKSEIKNEIITLCKKYKAQKVILFGSRARGDNSGTSDIDLAIAGAKDFDRLFADLKYNEFTLLDIDIINLDEEVSDELLQDIQRDGSILYEEGKL